MTSLIYKVKNHITDEKGQTFDKKELETDRHTDTTKTRDREGESTTS